MLTKLNNGIAVVTEAIPYVRSVAVGIWVRAGSRDEDGTEAGLSHFLEHMFFKGSETRTARDIAEAIDGVGGQLNAFTGKEYSCFYARVLDEHFPLVLDILTDMLTHPRFDPEDIDRERNVVLEEISSYEDTPDDLIHDLVLEASWGGHPLGRSILGPAEVVRGLDRARLTRLYRARYTPDNLVVAVAGRIDEDQVLEEVRARLDGLTGDSPRRRQGPPKQEPGRVLRPKDSEQVHLCLAGPSEAASESRAYYASQLLSTIMGGGTSSRLFQRIREERGLAYSIYTYTSSYRDAGLLTTYAGVGPAKSREVLEIILEEFTRFRREGPRPEELERARAQLKAGLMMGLESTTNRMMRLGRLQLTLGKLVSPDTVMARVEAVTRDDVADAADPALDSERLALAAIGPEEAVEALRAPGPVEPVTGGEDR